MKFQVQFQNRFLKDGELFVMLLLRS
jgi:hypothetical protein